MKQAGETFGPLTEALLSRKTLGQTMMIMAGYDNSKHKKNYYQTMNRLEKNGLIQFKNRDQFTLTDKGRGILLNFDIDAFELPEFDPKKWDGVWHVLVFDIPEMTRALRDVFRKKIQNLGFYTLQKSVYVTPRPCEKEMKELTKMLSINKDILVLHVQKLGSIETAVKKHFGIL